MNTTNKNPGFIEVTRAVPTDFNWARASFHEGVLGKKINSDFYKQSSMPKSLFLILFWTWSHCHLRKQILSLPSGDQQVLLLPLIPCKHGRRGWHLNPLLFTAAKCCWWAQLPILSHPEPGSQLPLGNAGLGRSQRFSELPQACAGL